MTPAPTPADTSVHDRARAWLAVDPDPTTRAELTDLLARGGTELSTRFTGRLAFGTAGLRGRLGAGPTRMNRVLVRTVAAALATCLPGDDPLVVVGHDARHGSADFARDTARVLAARGVRVRLIDGPRPTPVLAFAVRHHGADAGVMVTASHNPPADNGYKVYWSDGAQIIPPIDTRISEAIDRVGLLDDGDLAAEDHPAITVDDGTTEADYLHHAAGVVAPAGPRDIDVVYTPLHGVGLGTLEAAWAAAGFPPFVTVAEQAEPDPDFPTVAFPNPEEPGALDLAVDEAQRRGADLVLANDPDADRLAAVVLGPEGPRRLTGDEIGGLLADHLLGRGTGPDRLVVTTVVSSRLLARIAARHGVRHAETLTGFKWIVRPGFANPSLRFVLGYEEALGFAVSDAVADKDGITAALVLAELAATEKQAGRRLTDRLDDLARVHGLHVTAQRSRRIGGADPAATMAAAMRELRAVAPQGIGDWTVEGARDLSTDAGPLPPTDALVFDLTGHDATGRLVVRPSGTEPKIKVYGEVIIDPGRLGPDLGAARRSAGAALDGLLDAAPAALGLATEDS